MEYGQEGELIDDFYLDRKCEICRKQFDPPSTCIEELWTRGIPQSEVADDIRVANVYFEAVGGLCGWCAVEYALKCGFDAFPIPFNLLEQYTESKVAFI